MNASAPAFQASRASSSECAICRPSAGGCGHARGRARFAPRRAPPPPLPVVASVSPCHPHRICEASRSHRPPPPPAPLPPRRPPRRAGFAGPRAAAARAGAGGEKAAPPAPPPARVTVTHPAITPVRESWDYNGWLETTETVEVRARVRGLLTGIHFTEGTEVA